MKRHNLKRSYSIRLHLPKSHKMANKNRLVVVCVQTMRVTERG